MAMRSIVSCTTFRNLQTCTMSGLRRFTDKASRVLSEEERAKETVYVQKMERERLEKLKQKADNKENADKSDKKGDGDSQKS